MKRCVMVSTCGYATVEGDTEEEILENAKKLCRNDYDWSDDLSRPVILDDDDVD